MKTKDIKQKTLATKRHIFTFIENHPTGVLTTVDPNGNPHGSVIYYATDPDNNIIFITKQHTKKHDNLAHNNHAMLVVYDAEDQAVLQIAGEAELVEDMFDKQMDFAAVMMESMDASGYPFSPISKLAAGPYVVYRIKPKEMRLTTYGYPGNGTEVLEEPDN